MPASASAWRIGQRDESGWNIATETAGIIPTDVDFDVTVEIRGSAVTVRSNGAVRASWDFGTDLSDGQLALGSNKGMVRFDNVAVDQVGDPQVFEFVEIANTTPTAIDLEGWQLAGGVDLTMAAGTTLDAGETLVLVGFDPSDPVQTAAFRDRFAMSSTVAIVGPYAGNLSNSGEAVRLMKPLVPGATESGDVLVDQVGYDDIAPWPTAADGAGQSLQRLKPALFGNSAASWQSLPPSPGVTRSVAIGDMNLDGIVNGVDVDDFVLALSDPAAYALKHGIPATAAGDVDGDGDVDFDDIDDFVLRIQQQ